MRACAHDYAERLGLGHSSIDLEIGKTVRVSLKPAHSPEVASSLLPQKRKAQSSPPLPTISSEEQAKRQATRRACELTST